MPVLNEVYPQPPVKSAIERLDIEIAKSLQEQREDADSIFTDMIEQVKREGNSHEAKCALINAGLALAPERMFCLEFLEQLPDNHVLKKLPHDCMLAFLAGGKEYFNFLTSQAEEEIRNDGATFGRFTTQWAKTSIAVHKAKVAEFRRANSPVMPLKTGVTIAEHEKRYEKLRCSHEEALEMLDQALKACEEKDLRIAELEVAQK